MAANIKLTVPPKVKPFSYDAKKYEGGSKFETNDPCVAIKFYNAFKAKNKDGSRGDEIPNSWAAIDAACNLQNAAAPADSSSDAPIETVDGGDNPESQGAPSAPPLVTAEAGQPDKEAGSNNNPAPTEEAIRPNKGDPHPTHGEEKTQDQTNAGDPVDIFTGAFYLEDTDLVIPNTILPLVFSRIYRSGPGSFGPLGWNWDHNLNLFIRELNTGDIALWRNLHEDIFKFNGLSFDPPRGIFEVLERASAFDQIYEVKGKRGLVMHFERPARWVDGERIPLLWISDQHGNQLKFSYGAEDKLAKVIDDDGRFFSFQYDSCGLLISVNDQSGRKFEYGHDEQTMQLVCVKSPGISDHPNGIYRTYHYEQPWSLPELRHNIIRVEDSEGNVYLENTYDRDPSSWSYARVIEQLYGGFLYQFQYTQLQWVPPNALYINIPAVRVEVMNPDFGLETYTFNYRGDLLDRRYRLNKDKSFRVVAWLYEFDEQGNLSKTTSPDGSEEINTFDFNNLDPRMRGNLLQKEITSASGFPASSRIIWKGKYEPIYQHLIEEKDESGQVTKYKFDFDITPAALNNTGKLMQIKQPDVTLPDSTRQSAVVAFEYNSKGQITNTILPNGVKNQVVYGVAGDEKGRPIKQIYDFGNLNIEENFKYDIFGYVAEKLDGNGNAFKQFNNALGLVEKYTLPPISGISSEFILHYNSDKKVIASEKPKGNYVDSALPTNNIIDEFARDVLGYPIKYNLSSNTSEVRTIKLCNDYRGFPLEIVIPDGSKIRKTFDERGKPLTEEIIGFDGKKITTKKFYDRSGKLTHEINATGLTTKYKYDGFSRLVEVTLPNGTKLKYKWLINDLLKSEETIGDDGTGLFRQLAFKTYTYDEKNRVVTETVKVFSDNPSYFANVITTIFYDVLDRPVKVINHRGGVIAKQYDGLGRLTSEIDPEGNKEYYFYDSNGNLIKEESHHLEPDGTVSVLSKQFQYDVRNRRVEMIEPDGAIVKSEYDDRGQLVRQIDRSGIIREFFYDSFNNKIKQIENVGGLDIEHKWQLDNLSQIVAYIDPTGQTSHYKFDSLGRNYNTDYPNGFSSTKEFNSNNLIIKETLGSGVEFEYSYDTFNRLITIENTSFPASIIKVDKHEFRYDGLDRVLSAKVGAEEIKRKYDSLNRLSTETALGNTISCNYDDVNGEVLKVWPDGRSEKLSHNLNGVLSSIDEITHGTLGSGINQIAKFKTSGPAAFGEAKYFGGVTIFNSYDNRKRLTEINVYSANGTNENIKYRYNTSDFKQVEALLGQNPKISFFEFDTKYRLTSSADNFSVPIPNARNQTEHDATINIVKAAATLATHIEKFQYDLSDARTQKTETGMLPKNYTYNLGHKIQNDGFNAYTHNLDGTLSSDGVFEYLADSLGRIVKIKSGAITITEIFYDALGRPSILKEKGQPEKSFHYLGSFVEQINENGIPARQITTHPVTGVPIAYHSASNTHYTLFDARYNLVGLLDILGNLVETYRYQSFGKPNIYNKSGIIVPESLYGVEPIFGGQRYLVVSGLFLSKRRLMNPLNGLFLSCDPKGYANSSSLYIYALQSPIDFIDPEGEIAFLAILAVMAVGALVSAALNAVRQGIAISEGSQKGWEWDQFGKSVGIGAIAAPILVVAPELAVPLAAMGVAGGIGQLRQGHYGTGAFDIITSVAPFGFKGPRNATFGSGTRIGQMRGLGESATWGTRIGRFDLIGRGITNFRPSFFGKRIGLGFSRGVPGGRDGHVAVTFEAEGSGMPFIEKNGDSFRALPEPPEFYIKPRPERPGRPFEYESLRIPRSSVDKAQSYATERSSVNPFEGFDKDCANCSHFASDVLNEAGFKDFGTGRGRGLWSNFKNFGTARSSAYSAPFLSQGIHPNEKHNSK